MPTKKNYHHGNLRNQLIETALDIIEEDGLENVSMRGLGNRIGVSRTAPYRHFSNKGELLSAISEQGYGRLTQVLSDVNTREGEDSLARLMDIGIAYVEFAMANPVHYRIMFGNEVRERHRTPSLIEAAQSSFNALLTAVRRCLAEKKIKPFDPVLVANTLWATAHGLSSLVIDRQIPTDNAFQGLPALLEKKAPGTPNVRKLFESMGQIFFLGLLNDRVDDQGIG